MLEFLLSRHLWATDLGVVLLCCALCGMAGANVVNIRRTSPSLRIDIRRPPGAARSVLSSDKRPEAIVARNIFCSDCLLPLDTADFDEEIVPESSSMLPLALLAVMYAPTSRLGHLSIAVIKDTESKEIGAFALGDRILGATITDIRATRIYLDRDGAHAYLDLMPAPVAPVRKTGAVSPSVRDAITRELDRGIKKLGEHRYEVERRTLESVLENVGLLSRAVRPVPALEEGKMVGFRLFAVHPDGAVAKIGLRNGDVLSSINGLELSRPEQVIEAFGKLRSASHLSLQVERGSLRVVKEYVIR